MGAVVVPLAGVAVGPDGAAAASAARGRLQDLSEAPAHRTTSVVGQTPAQRMAKVHWRTPAYTPQPEATVGDGSSPCPVTCYLSEIKWRTVQPEPAQRVGSSGSSQERGRMERLKVTKALTVGVTKDRMHTSPTSQHMRPAGWVSSKVLLPEEPEDVEEKVGDQLDGDAHTSISSNVATYSCVSAPDSFVAVRGQEAGVRTRRKPNRAEEVCPEILHTRAVRNLEELTRSASGHHT